MAPFFSIIIPCYNSAQYIDATLHSLSVQTYRQFEVIIVDDGSTDDSVDICTEGLKKYRLSGLVLARPQDVIKGVASCRNLGVSKANAEWICFLDSDDLFLPDKLALIQELIVKYRENCLAYHHGTRNFEDGSNKTLLVLLKEKNDVPEDVSQELLDLNIIVTSTVTINKTLFNELGGFDTSLHGVEDYFLWLRIAKRTKWSYCSKVLTDYRVRTQSLMGGRKMTHYVTQGTALIKKVKQTGDFSEDEIRRVDKYLFQDLMSYYAMVSLNTRGWGDFSRGLLHLAMNGRGMLAGRLFFKFFKRHALTIAAGKLKK